MLQNLIKLVLQHNLHLGIFSTSNLNSLGYQVIHYNLPSNLMYRTIQDPASQRLTWYKPPLTVLVIKKVRDAAVIPPFFQLVQWFINEKVRLLFKFYYNLLL